MEFFKAWQRVGQDAQVQLVIIASGFVMGLVYIGVGIVMAFLHGIGFLVFTLIGIGILCWSRQAFQMSVKGRN